MAFCSRTVSTLGPHPASKHIATGANFANLQIATDLQTQQLSPRDWANHPAHIYPFYKSTQLRGPTQPLVPLIPGVTDRLGVISFSRNFVTWYKAREQLLEAKLQPEFDKFETGLATFLPG